MAACAGRVYLYLAYVALRDSGVVVLHRTAAVAALSAAWRRACGSVRGKRGGPQRTTLVANQGALAAKGAAKGAAATASSASSAAAAASAGAAVALAARCERRKPVFGLLRTREQGPCRWRRRPPRSSSVLGA